MRGKPAALVLEAVDPLIRATVALCGGLVIATPLFFATALLWAVLWPGSFAGEPWLVGLWLLASAVLARSRSALSAVCAALFAAGAACLAAALARLLIAGGAPLDAAAWAVNAGFLVAGALALVAGALLRRGPHWLWTT